VPDSERKERDSFILRMFFSNQLSAVSLSRQFQFATVWCLSPKSYVLMCYGQTFLNVSRKGNEGQNFSEDFFGLKIFLKVQLRYS